jgi:hypothetical protein
MGHGGTRCDEHAASFGHTLQLHAAVLHAMLRFFFLNVMLG